MKIKKLIALGIAAALAVSLCSCSDDKECTEHVDENKNGLCDICGAEFACEHTDTDFNHACDKCGEPFEADCTEHFDDDTKDAGEIGAGHTVTALYEIIPVDSEQEVSQSNLKYQDNEESQGLLNGEWMNLKIRYKEPDGEESKLCEYPITKQMNINKEDFVFASSVAEFALILRDSKYKSEASIEHVCDLLKQVDTESDSYRDEFQYLVKKIARNSGEM